MSRTPVVCTVIASAALLAASAILTAGPLDPPAGPIAPTYKTLTEVEPRIAINATNTPGYGNSVYRIAARGSYYLTGNLAGAASKHTIEVESDNVTIDLNGFALTGAAGSFDGINVPNPRRGVAIRNGTIRDHGARGVFMSNTSAGTIQDLVISGNTLDGIWLGANSTLERVRCVDNIRDGFVLSAANGSTLTECTASGNDNGFENPGGEIIFTRCIARSNSINGFEVSTGGRALDCVSAANAGVGFQANGNRVTLEGCNAEFNGAGGFLLQSHDNVLTRCIARSNGRGSTPASGFRTIAGQVNTQFAECHAIYNGKSGFEITAIRNSLTRCTALENGDDGVEASGAHVTIAGFRAEANAARGLDLGAGSAVDSAAVRNNDSDGIRINGNGNAVIRNSQIVANGAIGLSVGNGSVVEDCLIHLNVNQGCMGVSLSTVKRCTFDTNGTAAGNLHPNLSFSGGGNLIEDNYIFNGDSGIVISFGGGSIVRRNICNGTANNYGGIVGGNRVAPLNNSATLTTTNPNDNFNY
ncbi:MAG: right-handed parallel beta-helix repeat-containing protein [Phycisphaerales bacterium]|nr:right-handed parallel beta-helix repeat-containing protein [Phycisphaerales bacterium]